MQLCYVLLFVLSLLCWRTHTAVLTGSLVTTEQWHFLGKFCFSNQFGDGDKGAEGDLAFNITTPSTTLKLVLYLDTSEEGSWEEVYKIFKSGNYTCDELVSMRRQHGEVDVRSGIPGHKPTRQFAHPYYWFVAAADCSRKEGLALTDYRLEFTNPVPGNSSQDKWYRQFSYDHQGLGQAYICFFVFFLIVLSVHLWGVFQLVKMNSYHTLVKLVTLGLSFIFFSSMCHMIHYASFADNGVGSPGMDGLGLALDMLSQLSFMFLCVLISKGWTITTNHLSQAIAVPVVLGIMVILYTALFIWDYVGRDPASTIYFYDSAVGYLIIVLRLFIFAWFCWSMRETLQIERESTKRTFYYIFAGLSSLWFLILPFIVLLALGISVWARFRAVTGIGLVSDSFGFVAMVYLFWPSKVDTYFTFNPTPLHDTVVGTKQTSSATSNYETL